MTLIDLVSDSPFRAGAAGAALMLALVWLVSVRIKDASIVDMFWGLGFSVIAASCLLVTENLAPLTAATLWLVILWGVRLFVHLGTRWRREGEEDYRIKAFREAVKALESSEPERARAILMILSDPTTTPIPEAKGKSASGAYSGES